VLFRSGEVIWFFYNQEEVGDARRLKNGNLLVESNRTNSLVEMDMLGNVMQHWHPTGTDMGDPPDDSMPIATDTLHHEVYEMPSENFLSLSTELRIFDDFPTSAEDPDAEAGPSAVIGDVIVEFERDGTIVHEYRLMDILDPYRITHASMNPGFWPDHYEPKVDDLEATPLRDWAHVNAIVYDDQDDSYIVSARRQDAVLKIARETGELMWILGPPDNWKEPWSARRLQPAGDLQWQYRQHGSVLTGDGNILLYDNGGRRAGAYKEGLPLEEMYSRVVEFAVDEETMSVEQVWTYDGRPDDTFYSGFLSDADWLPVTGNVLITDGARRTNDDGVNADGEDTNYWGRIVEVTHTEPAEVVFEVHLKDGGVGNWHIYRGERLSSLYP
jgi:arylsulfate sulfotransferase